MEEEKNTSTPEESTKPVADSKNSDIEKLTDEIVKLKRERDEANSQLRTMQTSQKTPEKSEFDEIFGGKRK